jgi:ribose transport system ATP-binding protein
MRRAGDPPLAALRGICKSFDGQPVLREVDFELRAGEVHALAGENGAGKTTLMRILGGVLAADSGTILVGGRRRRFRSVHDAARAGIALIHQELSLCPSLSVADNLFLGREHTGFAGWLLRRRQEGLARRLLARVGLAVDPGRAAGELPLGARQLVEIAKAISREARIIVMDEPTSALSAPEAQRLFSIIRELTSRGAPGAAGPAGIVYITHRMEEIERLADRVTVLRDGRRVLTERAGLLTGDRLVEAIAGRPVTERARRPAAGEGETEPGTQEVQGKGRAKADGEEILRVEGLSARHRRFAPVEGVSLRLRAGEVVGLAGLAGCGASTLLHALFGDARVLAGRVLVRGRPAAIGSPRAAMRQGLALVPGDRRAEGLCIGLGVGENLTLPSLRECSPLGVRRPGRERRAALQWIEALRIRCRGAAQTVRTLSGGNQQKVALGMWVMRRPAVLLLDDPTRGVDVGAKQEIYELVGRLTAEGMGVIVASGDPQELLRLADRFVVLHRGRVALELDRAGADAAGVLAAAMGGRGASEEAP